MKRRVRMEIAGIVQGVGFRPYLHRLAERFWVCGWVRNTTSGVELELEGEEENLRAMEAEIRRFPPPLAAVERITCTPLASMAGYTSFSILDSAADGGRTLVSPDIAPCPDCLRELKTPGNRRYRYPFLNCTNCGPRYTIIRGLPYDRPRTSMAGFAMCPDCKSEYGDIRDRRYHAQPDCCPACGPSAVFADASGAVPEGDPFALAQSALAAGKIIAVKGLGGFHLACDAADEAAVRRLRARKKRPDKPLAVMGADCGSLLRFCRITEEEKRLLAGPRAPIILCEKRDPDAFAWLSETARLGVMLPSTPLHVLLADGAFGGPGVLVMTSANPPGCPVVLDNEEALRQLSGIADGFLLHNRPIANRCDDSLVMLWQGREYFFRRSRGYAPEPVRLPFAADGVFAMGAEQKASFAIGRETSAFLSPHIGDLKNMEILAHYRGAMQTYERLFRVPPARVVCDLHPDYSSTAEARRLAEAANVPLLAVQHHWAHMASSMADNGLEEEVFGIVWDGTGLGTDQTVWGGEFLTGDYRSFRRVGSIRPVLLPGGDAAVREIGRIALSLLWDAGLPAAAAPIAPEAAAFLSAMLQTRTQTPAASSIGRLFDGVFALITGRRAVSYEGQGAQLLEAMARPDVPGRVYPTAFEEADGLTRFDFRPLIAAICADLGQCVPAPAIARGFMDTLCRMALAQCETLNPRRLPVVLSGGVFCNRYLLTNLTRMLTEAGYRVYTHHRVSPGDEGLCLGQLAIAAHRKE